MARQRGAKRGKAAAATRPVIDLAHYLEWTRDASVSFVYLLPLLTAYEVGLALSGSSVRNTAGWILLQKTGLGGEAWFWFQKILLLVVLFVAGDVVRRRIPVVRMFPAFLLEAGLFALLLGPVVGSMVEVVGLAAHRGQPTTLEGVLLSLGAGAYEELLFRFLILAGLYSALAKACRLPRVAAFLVALLLSSAAFALYHNLGVSGEPLEPVPLLFRFLAGILLGALFAWRGLALCAWLHALYDVLLVFLLGGSGP